MKRWFHIAFAVVLAVFSACNRPVETRHGTSLPSAVSPQLQAVDSLMWTRPDSALALLPDCRDGVHTVSTAYDRHYANLLLSELLYKNEYGQTNREELLEAVDYFDSLTMVTDTRGVSLHRPARRDTSNVSANHVSAKKTSDPTLAFLDARAHYINGVGCYERDSVVEACKEYLKALEVMEGRFEDKELVGKKAQFMTYIYNRLGDMFEEQLLAEPAIACYKQALFYCRRKPSSKYGVPVLLYHLGVQFDITSQKDSAAFYYDAALANMPDSDNIHYRDIIVNKTIFAYYNSGYSSDSLINDLKHLAEISADEGEKAIRLWTLGNILFEDKQYDSAQVYLETVFERQKDLTAKIMAAENLCSIYQMEGDSTKAQKYGSFLSNFTTSEIENNIDISRINEMFKEHLAYNQGKQFEERRAETIKWMLCIIIPMIVVLALTIIVLAKHKSKKLLKERDKRYAQTMETERYALRMEQAALSGRLKSKNKEVQELKDQIKQFDDLAGKTDSVASFNEEPICRLIMERVNEGQFKAKIDCKIYKSYALDKQQLLDLRVAADRHFSQFTLRLRKAYPKLTNIDVDYCCLYLLNLTYADVSALMQRAYNTVVGRDSKIQTIIGSEKPLPVVLMDMAQNPSYI